MSLQYRNFGPLTAEIDRIWEFGAPNKFQRVSRLGFVIAPTSLNGGQPRFVQCLAVAWAGTLPRRPIHFWGLLSHNGIVPGAKFTFRPILR